MDIYGHNADLVEDFTHYSSDPDLLEMRTVLTDPRRYDDADPWVSRCYWTDDLFDAARMADIARRG